MESWVFITFVIVVGVVAFVAWSLRTDKQDTQWQQVFTQNLVDKYGSNNLAEIYERELQPALEALKTGDYFAVTTHFTKLADGLASISTRSAVTDFDIRYAQHMFDQVNAAFLKKHNLFEPSAPIGRFFGPTPPVEFAGKYVPASSMRYGDDWVSIGFEIFPLSAVTNVEVYADGQKIVNYTSRASLSSGVLGAVLPGSSLLWAMARPKVTKHVDDDREACILVSGENFELELEIAPGEKKDARFFAKQLQKQVEIAKGLEAASLHGDEGTSTGKEIGEATAEDSTKVSLEKLAEMYTQGLISAEEFATLKKNL